MLSQVCCPPEPLWDTFKDFKPVMFNEIINYETVLRDKDDDDLDDRNLPTNIKSNKTSGSDGDVKLPNVGDKKADTTKKPNINEKQLAITDCGKDYSNSNRIIGKYSLDSTIYNIECDLF